MAKFAKAAILQLCKRLQIDHGFLMECLDESVIAIREVNGRLDLDNGTVLNLRRLQRLCSTFQLDAPVAAQLLMLTRRVAELENELRKIRTQSHRIEVYSHESTVRRG